MRQRITRRVFTKAGAAATLGLTSLETASVMGSPRPDPTTRPPTDVLEVRPYHLMCMSCFYGGRMEKLAPIKEDNLFEAIDVIQKDPDIPVTLVPGCCMICPPCSHYDPQTNLCHGGRSMALRDQKKDLDVLQKLGLKYGDTFPARELYKLLYDRVPSTRDICGYGDGEERAPEWSICGDPEGKETYRKALAANLGIKG